MTTPTPATAAATASPLVGTAGAGQRLAHTPNLVAKLVALLDDDSDSADVRRHRLNRILSGVDPLWREAAHLRLATIMVVAVPHPAAISDMVTRCETLAEALAELRAEQPETVGRFPWSSLLYASSLRHLVLHDVRLGEVELRILARNVTGLSHLALHECVIGSIPEFCHWIRGSRYSLRTLCIVSSRPPLLLEDSALARWSQACPKLQYLTLIFSYGGQGNHHPHARRHLYHHHSAPGSPSHGGPSPSRVLWGTQATPITSPTSSAFSTPVGPSPVSSFMSTLSLPTAFASSSSPTKPIASSLHPTHLPPTILTPVGLHTLAANCPRLHHLALDVPLAAGLALDDLTAALYMLRDLRFLALGATCIAAPANTHGVPPDVHVQETLSLLFPLVQVAAMDPDVVIEVPTRPPTPPPERRLGQRQRAMTLPAGGGGGLFASMASTISSLSASASAAVTGGGGAKTAPSTPTTLAPPTPAHTPQQHSAKDGAPAARLDKNHTHSSPSILGTVDPRPSLQWAASWFTSGSSSGKHSAEAAAQQQPQKHASGAAAKAAA
ncbi:hypothetical protein BCR44DRAFT_33581 [Catenaria anguillulae PL171]|uniref:Uncharacterized protein n=1 Tax=Catenaria anguillulae PL171 TaxID=765915 RepID=A0A1Y2HJL4_9FUNG|nr:hypothetical protein BCR44DRAFT_33581 [Catenaria anguillulae PL171]